MQIFPLTDPYAIPVGGCIPWAGTIASVPTGWLFCDHSAVSRTTYAKLFTAIGTIHGVGDGSTTFNLPSTVDRFIVGAKADSSGIPKSQITGGYSQSGGAKAHTHNVYSNYTYATGNDGGNFPVEDNSETTSADHIGPFYAMPFIIKAL